MRDSEAFMTTREVEELLKVDRLTIYRMLDAGELPGFKIGRQWRFDRRAITTWLEERGSMVRANSALPVPTQAAPPPAAELLPTPYVFPVQEVFAEALGIGAVLTDMEGIPLMPFSHPWAFCQCIFNTAKGRQGCIESWKRLSESDEDAPTVAVCHAGLNYARATVTVDGEPVARLAGGMFLSEERQQEFEAGISELAQRFGIDETELRVAAISPRLLSAEARERLVRTLKAAGTSLSSIAQYQADVQRRLEQIVLLSRQPIGSEQNGSEH